MKAWIGKTVVVMGAIHCLFGAIVFGDLLAPAFRAGLLNTISASTPPERNMAYWFMMLGLVTLMLGGLIDRLERSALGLPAFLPWGFLAFALIGSVMSPVSGFWLMWVPTIGLFLRRRADRASSPSALSPVAEQAAQPDAPEVVVDSTG